MSEEAHTGCSQQASAICVSGKGLFAQSMFPNEIKFVETKKLFSFVSSSSSSSSSLSLLSESSIMVP
jgi:hypothetical protein